MNGASASLTLETALGAIELVASEDALLAAAFDAPRLGLPANTVCHEAAAQLNTYLAGQRMTFDVPLAPGGTVFQRQVWQALGEVPWGRSCTYGELAAALGRPTASRAVGAAVGRNPLAVFIPCHRVLGADGRLTGFAWGLERKRALLALEGFDACS